MVPRVGWRKRYSVERRSVSPCQSLRWCSSIRSRSSGCRWLRQNSMTAPASDVRSAEDRAQAIVQKDGGVRSSDRVVQAELGELDRQSDARLAPPELRLLAELDQRDREEAAGELEALQECRFPEPPGGFDETQEADQRAVVFERHENHGTEAEREQRPAIGRRLCGKLVRVADDDEPAPLRAIEEPRKVAPGAGPRHRWRLGLPVPWTAPCRRRPRLARSQVQVGQTQVLRVLGVRQPQPGAVEPEALADAALGPRDRLVELRRGQAAEAHRELREQRLEAKPLVRRVGDRGALRLDRASHGRSELSGPAACVVAMGVRFYTRAP